MFAHPIYARLMLIAFCMLGLASVTHARKADADQSYERSQSHGTNGQQQKGQPSLKQRYSAPNKQPRQQKQQPAPAHKLPQRKPQDRGTWGKPGTAKDPRHYPQTHSGPSRDKDRSQRSDTRRDRDKRSYPRTESRGDRDRRSPSRSTTTHRDRDYRTDRDRSRATSSLKRRYSHDRHYRDYYANRKHRDHHYHRHETYRYHTRYLAPIRHHYYPLGFRIRVLPRAYITVYVGGLPYYYYGGVFYRYNLSGYVVVRAPVGAYVNILPVGFISFYLGGLYYYYVNDTYYLWDDDLEAYVVVARPAGADGAIAQATKGRLFVYPNEGQSEEQQAKDRYECHRWAVHETGSDPTLDEDKEITASEADDYKRAISACLEGRGYTVK